METLEQTLEKESIDKTFPFGTQYLEKPKADVPGEVYRWNWQPAVPVYLGKETASWPGTTGTVQLLKKTEDTGKTVKYLFL